MDKPKITWYAKLRSEETFNSGENLYVGTSAPDENLVVDMQLWNNRWGTEAVEDLTDFRITLHFSDYEDSSLLSCITAETNGQAVEVSVDEVARQALLLLPGTPVLSGGVNNGSSTDNSNLQNFIPFSITFTHPKGKHLKENDLKSLYFEVSRG